MAERAQVRVGVMRRAELPFLKRLWRDPHVMRYADELPRLRGWTKSDDPDLAWKEYRTRRKVLGPTYTQLVIRTPQGAPIGESFFAPLPEGYRFGRWQKPGGSKAIMGDLKLLPRYWGRGLGSQAMRQVVAWVFRWTDCDLFIVPPHLRNPAAYRVYEKAGFRLFRGMRSAWNHRIMELTREDYVRERAKAGRPN
jgi:RimJ/RimL family protein N-acetyltransferase